MSKSVILVSAVLFLCSSSISFNSTLKLLSWKMKNLNSVTNIGKALLMSTIFYAFTFQIDYEDFKLANKSNLEHFTLFL